MNDQDHKRHFLLSLRTLQVPVLLDTNVSCPEGVNEVLAEDDVSWQIQAVGRNI